MRDKRLERLIIRTINIKMLGGGGGGGEVGERDESRRRTCNLRQGVPNGRQVVCLFVCLERLRGYVREAYLAIFRSFSH